MSVTEDFWKVYESALSYVAYRYYWLCLYRRGEEKKKKKTIKNFRKYQFKKKKIKNNFSKII